VVVPVAIPDSDPLPESNIGVPKLSEFTFESIRFPEFVSVIVIVLIPEDAKIDAPAVAAAALISLANCAAEAAGYPEIVVSAIFGETVKVVELPSVMENCRVAEGYDPVPPGLELKNAARSGEYARVKFVVSEAFPPPDVLIDAVT